MSDQCGVCGTHISAVPAFSREFSRDHRRVFVDGRHYDLICLICVDTPACVVVDIGGGLAVIGQPTMPLRLRSINEMVEDGYDKLAAAHSLKCVKKAISKGKPGEWEQDLSERWERARLKAEKMPEHPVPDKVVVVAPKPMVSYAAPADPLKCPKCGKLCSSTSGATLHLKSCQGKRETSLTCPKCGKTCSSTSGFTLHMKSHG